MNNVNAIYIAPLAPQTQKTKNCPKNAEKRQYENFFYNKWDPLLWVLCLWGIFPISRNKTGQFELRWISPKGVYCLLVAVFQFFFNILILRERFELLFSCSLSFDDLVYNVAMTVTQALLVLPSIFLWESPKFVKFYNNFAEYERQYNEIASTPIKKLNILVLHSIAVSFFFIISFLVYFGGRNTTINMMERNGVPVNDSFFLYSYLLVPTKFFILLGLMVHWKAHNEYLGHCSMCLIEEIEKCEWVSDKELHPYVTLWHKLYVLHGNFGSAAGLSYSSFFLTIFLFYLTAIYMSIAGILPDLLKTFAFLLLVGIIMSILIEQGCVTATKVGDEFRSRLTALLSEGMDYQRDTQLIKFIETINIHRPTMSLAGFFNFERKINIAMYSSIITYFIIIIQFRVDYGKDYQTTEPPQNN